MRVEKNDSASTQVANLFKSTKFISHTFSDTGGVILAADRDGEQERMMVLDLGQHPNKRGVVSVTLNRDNDRFAIPYTSIYGVTLIATLRMGLDSRLRDKLFGAFLDLSLYEDMAPWNIVLNGPHLAYIDYDTRERTFDKDVSRAYQLLSILMNYKRTVEDFKRCGPKAGTVYNLPFISDCVGDPKVKGKLSCPDLALPVPCGDGVCHSDYISCLRSLAASVESFVKTHSTSTLSIDKNGYDKGDSDSKKDLFFSDLSSMLYAFDKTGLTSPDTDIY